MAAQLHMPSSNRDPDSSAGVLKALLQSPTPILMPPSGPGGAMGLRVLWLEYPPWSILMPPTGPGGTADLHALPLGGHPRQQPHVLVAEVPAPVLTPQLLFLIKKNKHTYSTEPNHLKSSNSFCYNELIHCKKVGVEPAANSRGVVVIMKQISCQQKPATSSYDTFEDKQTEGSGLAPGGGLGLGGSQEPTPSGFLRSGAGCPWCPRPESLGPGDPREGREGPGHAPQVADRTRTPGRGGRSRTTPSQVDDQPRDPGGREGPDTPIGADRPGTPGAA
ncbi:hypothetical protein QTO34_000765 [Cnephaeus nilssonii]|uniref:Large ribosomal subunit protein eL28 n=1 Tax=Cnephaeus nilssonii TaxID=3371016 RepID=A0AA40LUY8_CNENI|nr:hypothetical protein QTO34_000765 [Eptesicus nilssonii]